MTAGGQATTASQETDEETITATTMIGKHKKETIICNPRCFVASNEEQETVTLHSKRHRNGKAAVFDLFLHVAQRTDRWPVATRWPFKIYLTKFKNLLVETATRIEAWLFAERSARVPQRKSKMLTLGTSATVSRMSPYVQHPYWYCSYY